MSKTKAGGSLLDWERDERAQLKDPPRMSGVLAADGLLAVMALIALSVQGCRWWGWPWGLVLPGVTITVVFSVPWSRRFVVGWFLCDLTRSRLRRGLWEARVCTRRGHIPWVLWVSSTPVGQRVRLWMRPGTALEQLGREDDRNVKLGIIRAAVMAREVRVSRSPRFASLVTVEVIRRDPLGRRTVIASPLARTTPVVTQRAANGTPLANLASSTATGTTAAPQPQF